MPELSIIVPVYKTEKYLERCLTSILNQRYNDFELILVDDGSPDRCPEICDSFALQDQRIHVIHIHNSGVAAARNRGLNIAKGKYITLVDSDDWIEANMYESMMTIARDYDCDMVMCDCIKDYEDYSEVYTHEIRKGFYDCEQLRREYYPHLLMMDNVEYPPTISNWLCIFRRSILNDLRYIEGVRFSEDLLFGAQMIYMAKSFYYMKGKTYYHYCINSDSASHTFSSDKWIDYVMLHKAAKDYFLTNPSYDFQYQIDLMLLFFLYNSIGDIHRSEQHSWNEKREMIRNILTHKEVREMFTRVSIKRLNISWKLKIRTWLYKYRIGLI